MACSSLDRHEQRRDEPGTETTRAAVHVPMRAGSKSRVVGDKRPLHRLYHAHLSDPELVPQTGSADVCDLAPQLPWRQRFQAGGRRRAGSNDGFVPRVDVRDRAVAGLALQTSVKGLV